MFSERCANPECGSVFDYRRGHFFRFHKDHPSGEKPPNTHSVQHFWLCDECCREHTLEYQQGCGVLLKIRKESLHVVEAPHLIAAA